MLLHKYSLKSFGFSLAFVSWWELVTIIVLLSPKGMGYIAGIFYIPTKGLPLVEKTLTPAFASLFPCGFAFPCICPVFHACAFPGAASKAGSLVGTIQFPGQLGRD